MKLQGVYFAKEAKYSIVYCSKNMKIHNGMLCMLACRVIIGETSLGSPNCLPPLKSDGQTRVETLVNDVSDPTIFVSTRDYYALPVYYIWFDRKDAQAFQNNVNNNHYNFNNVVNFNNNNNNKNKSLNSGGYANGGLPSAWKYIN